VSGYEILSYFSLYSLTNQNKRPPEVETIPEQPTKRQSSCLGRIQEALECSICFEMFDQPRVLPCGHTFCMSCLVAIKQRNSALPCPQCRIPSPQHTWQRNFVIEDVVSRYLEGKPRKVSAELTQVPAEPAKAARTNVAQTCWDHTLKAAFQLP